MPTHRNVQVLIRDNPATKSWRPFTHIDLDDEPRIASTQTYLGVAVQIDDIDDELGIFCTRVSVPNIQQT